MEIRVLRYFLGVAREENMTRAAERLHISQPSLSKEIKKLENELGHTLFVRTNKSMHLTDEGMLLRKRAEDILSMVDKTAEEFSQLDNIIGGEIRIGCAESYLIKYLARSIRSFKEQYPDFIFHVFSGDTEPVAERLDRGLLDLAVIVEPPNLSKYNYLTIPESDKWGVVMRRDSPLAEKREITFEDLYGLPLFCSEQSIKVDFPRWCGDDMDKLNFAGSFNLSYNGSIFVKEGLGYLLTFEHLINTSEESGLCFRPITPELKTDMYIIWKKYQVFSPIVDLFVRRLREEY
ncbi:MAG: LysR family transcriptional regulator [Clostridia bacterium]|nr:LysR family transcriptional regulator [Clostridia bacterium]MBR2175826.1 LysR family transcriptional regulator [Clostridia bacterium]